MLIGSGRLEQRGACATMWFWVLTFVTLVTTGCSGRLMGGRILNQTPTVPTLAAMRPSLSSLQVETHRPGYIVPLAVQHMRDDIYCVVMGYTRKPDETWATVSLEFSHSVTLASHFSLRGKGVYSKCVNGRSAKTHPMTNAYAAERLAFFDEWQPVYSGTDVEIRDHSGNLTTYRVWGAYFRFEFVEPCERVLVRLATQRMGKVEYWSKWTEVPLVVTE
jgi:hypothetical protein